MSLPRPFGPYELARQLAVGGMAEVYLARARSVAGFEKTVALKMIHPRFSEDPEFARLLVEEANITAQLSHRNVVQVIDLGQIDETHYIAMEYVDGLDLSRLLTKLRERGQRCSFRLAAFITREVCDGLEHAHRKLDPQGKPLKIIHRDVSPPNILLSASGEVKLTDFGIAKAAMRASSTEAGVVKGKYGYMSPEQARGVAVDHRTDVFAAGAVLYELATGQPVYREAPLPVLLDKVTKGIYDPPERVRPDLPPQLIAVLKRALAPNANDRYPSARAMADDLNSFLFTLAPNPEFELSQLLTTILEAAKPSIPPAGAASLFDDDSDDSTQIESMAVVRQKMAEEKGGQATAKHRAQDAPGGFTDEPTRAMRRKEIASTPEARAAGFTGEREDAPAAVRPSTAAPRARSATPGPLESPPPVRAPVAPAPAATSAPAAARVRNPGISTAAPPAMPPRLAPPAASSANPSANSTSSATPSSQTVPLRGRSAPQPPALAAAANTSPATALPATPPPMPAALQQMAPTMEPTARLNLEDLQSLPRGSNNTIEEVVEPLDAHDTQNAHDDHDESDEATVAMSTQDAGPFVVSSVASAARGASPAPAGPPGSASRAGALMPAGPVPTLATPPVARPLPPGPAPTPMPAPAARMPPVAAAAAVARDPFAAAVVPAAQQMPTKPAGGYDPFAVPAQPLNFEGDDLAVEERRQKRAILIAAAFALLGVGALVVVLIASR